MIYKLILSKKLLKNKYIMDDQFYSISGEQTLHKLKSNFGGLSKKDAEEKLNVFGPNKLPEGKKQSFFSIFLGQFKSPLIYILIFADVVGFFLKEYIDSYIILFILLFNAALGAIQEGRAQNTLAALNKLVKTNANVLRDGKEITIEDSEIVPGDIILLQEGEKVPADARLFEVHSLKIDEASLTGESEPVRKISETLKENLNTPEQKNMVFKGTTVSVGSGKAIVVQTGIKTMIGNISKSISETNTEIPLTKNLKNLARGVVVIVIMLTIGIFSLGILKGQKPKEMFITTIAITVAAIPEGLPLVLTVTLAAGVWRMSKKRVLVKKLQAVEALGQVNRIAVDKTGTITKNELIIQRVISGGKEYEIFGSGYDPNPKIKNPDNELILAARIGVLCSNSRISMTKDGQYRIIGDPTEGAMNIFAEKLEIKKDDLLLREYGQINDFPFDYEKKIHMSINQKDGKNFLAVTGAPEVILGLSDKFYDGGKEVDFLESFRKKYEKRFLELSSDGLRVIAFAYNNNAPENSNQDNIPQLVFGGLFAMRDGLRPDIEKNVQRARDAGITVFMVTGDHAETAKAIARQAGIWKEGDEVIIGDELKTMSDKDLEEKLLKTTVFARVTPEHKMKIIESYKKRGEIIAMTGDGVNDAPSLVAADLGIAMGKIGTEVAKEASDLVLMDDNFGDIISAVEEGRNMRQGLRRTITYLFSSNFGEILLIILALFFDLPIPLIAGQLIWMNVVTDTFFDISLSLEPKNPSLMKKATKIRKKLFDSFMLTRILIVGPIIAIGAFWLFKEFANSDPTKARTIALTALVVGQWFNSLSSRSETRSVFAMNPFSNKFLLGTLLSVMVLHIGAVYLPFMNKILRISPLDLSDWKQIFMVGIAVLVVEELRKFSYKMMEIYSLKRKVTLMR
ncbi:MAG: HAD family hydrolase [Candidatus Pacebacteria bacterium]|nr:HAD family hydrolase [Candidatus Paceibacterota bacterium]